MSEISKNIIEDGYCDEGKGIRGKPTRKVMKEPKPTERKRPR